MKRYKIDLNYLCVLLLFLNLLCACKSGGGGGGGGSSGGGSTAGGEFTNSANSSSVTSKVSIVNSNASVEPNSVAVSSSGDTRSNITITLADNNNRPLSSMSVYMESSRGTLDTITPTGLATISSSSIAKSIMTKSITATNKLLAITNSKGQVSFTIGSTSPGLSKLSVYDSSGAMLLNNVATISFNKDAFSLSNDSSIVASPSNFLNDSGSEVTVTIKDSNGIPIIGKAISLTTDQKTRISIDSSSKITNNKGQAQFSIKSIDSTATNVLAKLSVIDNKGAILLSEKAIVGIYSFKDYINQSIVKALNDKTSIEANNIDKTSIVVTLIDRAGMPVKGKGISLYSSKAADIITPSSAITNQYGTATFDIKSPEAGTSYLSIFDTSIQKKILLEDVISLTFKVPAIDAGVSYFEVTPSDQQLPANGIDTFNVSVVLKDAYKAPIANRVINLFSNRGAVVDLISPLFVTTNAQGKASFTIKSNTIGGVRLTVKEYQSNPEKILLETLPGVNLLTFAALADMNKTTMNISPTAIYADNESISNITVNVKDTNNAPMRGRVVVLYSDRINDSVSTQVATNTMGNAFFTIKSSTVGNAKLRYKIIDSSTIKETNFPATPQITFYPAPADPNVTKSSVVATANIMSPQANGIDNYSVVVNIKNKYGQQIPDGTTVTLSSNRGSNDTITADNSISTTVNGQVRFIVKSLVKGSATLTATVTDKNTSELIYLQQRPVITFYGIRASATNSSVEISNNLILANAVESSTITVTLRDSSNRLLQSNNQVSLNSSRGVNDNILLNGISNGVATFKVTSVTPGDAILSAVVIDSEQGNVNINQNANIRFKVLPVDSNRTTIAASKISVINNNIDYSTVTITTKNELAKSISGINISLSSSGLTPVTLSSTNQVTDANGVATFAVKSNANGTAVLTATVSSDNVTFTKTLSINFSPVPLSASLSNITSTTTSLIADGIESANIVVNVKNVNNENLSNITVTVISNRNLQGATIDTIAAVTSSVTDSNGNAIFTIKSNTAGSVVLSANTNRGGAITNLTNTLNITFNPKPLPADSAKSTIAASKTSVINNNIDYATITIRAIDSVNIPVRGKNVTLSSSGLTPVTLSSTNQVTDANGVATFTVRSTAVGSATITATIPTDTSNFTKSVVVNFSQDPLSGTLSTISSNVTKMSADGIETANIIVNIKKTNSVNAIGSTVTLTSSRNSQGVVDTILPASSVTTDNDGNATFTIKSSTYGQTILSASASISGSSVSLANTLTIKFIPNVQEYCSISQTSVNNDNNGIVSCRVESNIFTELNNNLLLARSTVAPVISTAKITTTSSSSSSSSPPPPSSSEVSIKNNLSAQQLAQRQMLIDAANIGSDMLIINEFIKKNPKLAEDFKRKAFVRERRKSNNNAKKEISGRKLISEKLILKSIRNSIENINSRKYHIRIYRHLRSKVNMDSDIDSSLLLDNDEIKKLTIEELQILNEKLSKELTLDFQLKTQNDVVSSYFKSPFNVSNNVPITVISGSGSGESGNNSSEGIAAASSFSQVTPKNSTCDFNVLSRPSNIYCLNDTQKIGSGSYDWDHYVGPQRYSNDVTRSLISYCDFTLKSSISCVKQQGYRGSCVIFSTIGGVETKLAAQNNVRTNLSEQALYYMAKGNWDTDYEDGYSSYVLADKLLENSSYYIPYEYQWNYNPGYSYNPNDPNFTNVCTNSAGFPGVNFGSYYKEYCSNTAWEGQKVCDKNDNSKCGYLTYVKNHNIGVKLIDGINIYNPSLKDKSINDMVLNLNQGNPVVISVMLTSAFYNDPTGNVGLTGVVPDPVSGEQLEGGHAMLAVGFIPCAQLINSGFNSGRCTIQDGFTNRGIFIVKNSWGIRYGDSGFNYISDLYMRSAYTLELIVISNATHVPPP